jgi:hypothetical protein
LFAPQLTGKGLSDLGFCGQLCDCDGDCLAEGSRCVELEGSDFVDQLGVTGYCSAREEAEGIECR